LRAAVPAIKTTRPRAYVVKAFIGDKEVFKKEVYVSGSIKILGVR
jgi:hypothetical protein